MKILWLVTNPRQNPSTRFRSLQYVEPLGRLGHQITVRSLLSPWAYGGPAWRKAWDLVWGTLGRIWDIATARRYDAVIVLREVFPVGPSWMETWLCRTHPKVVFDFDDAVYARFEQARNPLDRLRDFDKTRKLILGSCRTVAGSRVLADHARHYSRRVTLIPTVVDTDNYAVRNNQDHRPLIVGWMGTRNNLLHLRLVEPVLAELQRAHAFRFWVVSNQAFESPVLRVENYPWTENRERDYLQAFDVGIMPLADDPFSQGKCAFKLIQYMANGVPSICSPVGENTRVIQDGVNGFLAETPEAWRQALTRLLTEPDLRLRFGSAARKLVEERYSLAKGVAMWQALLEGLEARERAGKEAASHGVAPTA